MNPQCRALRAWLATTAITLLSGASLAAGAADTLGRAVAGQVNADRAAAAAQLRIDKLDQDAQSAAARYAQALADTDSLTRYNTQLDAQVKAQETEIASLEKQLGDLQSTEREVQPLMQEMVDTLAQFVALDLPFLTQERLTRVKNLKTMMTRADVSIAEKYRRILEAYQIELEYGRTVDAYAGHIGTGKTARTVNFVRVGRISLMYQTLDGSETGYWDAARLAWTRDDSYAKAMTEALRVARKIGAPDLLQVPVPAPREAHS